MARMRTKVHWVTANKSPVIKFEVFYLSIIRLTLALVHAISRLETVAK